MWDMWWKEGRGEQAHRKFEIPETAGQGNKICQSSIEVFYEEIDL